MANLSQHSYLPGRWHWRKVSPECVLWVLPREYKMHLLGLIRISSGEKSHFPCQQETLSGPSDIRMLNSEGENSLQAGSLCIDKIILWEKMLGLEPPGELDKTLPCHIHKQEILWPNQKRWRDLWKRWYHRKVPKVWQKVFSKMIEKSKCELESGAFFIGWIHAKE